MGDGIHVDGIQQLTLVRAVESRAIEVPHHHGRFLYRAGVQEAHPTRHVVRGA
jgi:hypothetical protein